MKAKLNDINLPRQPAIDAFTLDMMRHFNKLPPPPPPPASPRARSWPWSGSPPKQQQQQQEETTAAAPERVQPLIYATYQAYLRR